MIDITFIALNTLLYTSIVFLMAYTLKLRLKQRRFQKNRAKIRLVPRDK